MNKVFFVILILLTGKTFAQDVASLIQGHEDKAYSPKNKTLTDLVIDIEIPEITKQLNGQMIFGNIKELYFRVYWTAKPERVAVEINGLPDGFNEIKYQLKQAILTKFETVIPIGIEKKFVNYKLSNDPKNSKAINAKDDKALNAIPEYKLVFNSESLLERVIGKKPVGTLETDIKWEKSDWSEPRFYTKNTSMKSIDGPQTVIVESDIDWKVHSGIGLPVQVTTITTQKISIPGSELQENKSEEIINFKNPKVNIGEALKWFLANSSN